MGARGRPLRLGLRCLSLQFTSPSARFGVVTFISGSKVLHTLAPWWLALNVFQKNYGKKISLLFRRTVGSKEEGATHTCPLVMGGLLVRGGQLVAAAVRSHELATPSYCSQLQHTHLPFLPS